MSPRHASALGYIGQLAIATLPGIARAAANRPNHPLLGSDPESALTHLVQSLAANVSLPEGNGPAEEKPEAPAEQEEVLHPTGT